MEILIVVVLYKCRCEDSSTLTSLITLREKFGYEIYVYDNSSNPQAEKFCYERGIVYQKQVSENSLREAYSCASYYSTSNNFDWIILFDQDSEVTYSYLSVLYSDMMVNPCVYVKVPYVESDKKMISPYFELIGGYHRGIKKNQDTKIHRDKNIFAIGSFTALSVKVASNIDYMRCPFKIDFLDKWIYQKIQNLGYSISVLPITVQHRLSIHDNEKFVSPERYQNIVQAERLFIAMYRSGILYTLAYYMRILIRTLKIIKRNDRLKYLSALWGSIL